MHTYKRLALALLMTILASSPAFALIVDYNYVSTHNFDSLGQATYDNIGKQTWFFSHASVGSNMMNGMGDLRNSSPTTYQLQRDGDDGTPPTTITPGTVYDWSRGNPGWQAKYDMFKQAVEAGWGNSANFVMDKLCYIDQRADANVYLAMMDDLDDKYSATFVYTTLPLTTRTDVSNDLRNKYNETVRAYAEANNKLLFDIADLQAHDRSGNEYTYVGADGNVYQRLWSEWTYDSGHLDADGRVWIGEGWYAVAASQATPIPATALLLGCGLGGLAMIRRKFSPSV